MKVYGSTAEQLKAYSVTFTPPQNKWVEVEDKLYFRQVRSTLSHACFAIMMGDLMTEQKLCWANKRATPKSLSCSARPYHPSISYHPAPTSPEWAIAFVYEYLPEPMVHGGNGGFRSTRVCL